VASSASRIAGLEGAMRGFGEAEIVGASNGVACLFLVLDLADADSIP
jgi:hypothetical protein